LAVKLAYRLNRPESFPGKPPAGARVLTTHYLDKKDSLYDYLLLLPGFRFNLDSGTNPLFTGVVLYYRGWSNSIAI